MAPARPRGVGRPNTPGHSKRRGLSRGSPAHAFFGTSITTVVFIHGDAFVASGTEAHLEEVREIVCSKYLTKVRGILGPEPRDAKALIILNRVIEWRPDGIALEADPRHVELVLQSLGMETCKGSEVTGAAVGDSEDDSPELSKQEQKEFRSLAARCNFLSVDRLDIQFACKEICRRMSSPCEADWKMVKKLARFLKTHPRLVMLFEYQRPPENLSVIVDTDYAGCRRTRRSTNGGMIIHGRHLIKSWATTQTVVAMSSGEAEFYGLTKGACEGLGAVGLVEDMTGSRMVVEVATDSSAARGIATRRGVGKVKHLETKTLWVQDQVARGRVLIKKVDGQTNPADLLTKYLPGSKMADLLAKLPAKYVSGRHELAPAVQEASGG